MKWNTVKVKYTKQLDNGALKRVNESYLVAAMSFTDAEARIYEELGQMIRGEFSVTNITPIELQDLFTYSDCGEFFRCRVSYENIDADTEKAKRHRATFLVEAQTVKQATERMNEMLEGMISGYRLEEVKESKIVDIFPPLDVDNSH